MRLPCGIDTRSMTLVDHSITGSGSGSRRSSESARTMPGFRRDCSLQVQDRTHSMSTTASSHARSSPQDHTDPSISRVRVHLVNMGHQLPRRRILTARPLCTWPSFLTSPKPSVHASHSLTLLKVGSPTKMPLNGVRLSTRSHTSSILPIVTWHLGRALDT